MSDREHASGGGDEDDGDGAASSGGGDDGRSGEDGAADPSGPGPGLVARVREVWRNPAYRFVLLFLPYLGIVSIAYPLFVRHYNGVVQWFILRTAALEHALFSVFSDESRVEEKLVFFGTFAVKIIDECTGIYEMLIFAAAVMAFPTGLRQKAIGVLAGCPLIYLFNVARIAVLIVVGRFWPRAFDFMHLYFWQATMIVMITGVWLLWIMVVVRGQPGGAVAARSGGDGR